VFRVASIAPRPPTEEDILRWLQEAEEQEERAEEAAEEHNLSPASDGSEPADSQAVPGRGRHPATRDSSTSALRASA